ncbi:MAG: DUF1643 domain-containing protein [Paracoccaceae bacterium]|nr:DUF1643 domain-containing protein [Paracoccaceae bacterium]
MTVDIRRHSENGIDSEAAYSLCGRYRYALTRVWDLGGPNVLFIMLNPSTASELKNDPTIERCQRRAVRLGFGAMRICNLFAWRETSPVHLRRAKEPFGSDNGEAIAEGADWADQIICAWGVHGAHLDAGPSLEAALRADSVELFHLGLSKDGHPRHPLYISYGVTPQKWLA